MPEATRILEETYNIASSEFAKDLGKTFIESLPQNVKLWMAKIGEKPEKHKAIIAVLATLLAKKIEAPKQDIRYHRTDLKGGFSGRSYDTTYVTPFIKEKFGTRFAMKESGWLTRSFEKPEPFLLSYTGKITPSNLKTAFLHILDEVQKGNGELVKKLLTVLFIYLLRRKHEVEMLTGIPKISFERESTINQIIQSLNEHFLTHKASRLPVIAIYSVYKLLIREVKRYEGKKLKPLRGHVSPNLHAGLGDVEIIYESGGYFEVVEVKYGKPINAGMVEDVYGKLEGRKVARYYLLTTAEPYIKSDEEMNVKAWIEKIKCERGCEVVINGVLPTIHYYLRLLEKPSEFLNEYTSTLQDEFKARAEITDEHVKDWIRKLEKLRAKK